jgi:hypothetical protein
MSRWPIQSPAVARARRFGKNLAVALERRLFEINNNDQTATYMTKLQRILALEAALCACEGVIAAELGNDLKHWLDSYLNVAFPDDKGFGCFLEAQQEAVNALAINPQVFGGRSI